MAERWKKIENCDGRYEVSDYGRVRNADTGLVLKPRPLIRGYYRVHIRLSGKRTDYYIHRLVADAFCEHPDGCDVVNHIDNDPKNNRADNLEWTTQRDNVYYGMRQGRYRLNARPVVGHKNNESFLFSSAHEASNRTGCDWSGITKCCKGKQKTHHGYKWEYAEVIP